MSMRQLGILNYIEVGALIVVSGIGGIVIGTPLGKLLCQIIADLMRSNYMVYVFPVKYCLIYFIAILLIALAMENSDNLQDFI